MAWLVSRFVQVQRRLWVCMMGALLLIAGGLATANDSGDEHGHHTDSSHRGSRFAPKGTKPKYARHKPFQIKHIKLVLKILPRKRWIGGYAQLTIQAKARPIRAIFLDAAELHIQSVSAAGKRLIWNAEGHTLHITLGEALPPGKDLDVRIDYSATPRTGLHFIIPDKAYPKKPLVVFSQGESVTNRFWFPCYDTPDMRMTSETVITVPKALMVIANGKLLKRTEAGTFATYHHKMKYSHVSYLTSIVVGRFALYKQEWGGIPILSYVHPSQLDKAKRSFENTADMMKFFSESIGFKYPYTRYAQVTVPDFVAGGMENITATTLTHRTLHDEGAHLYRKSDGLVAHELAHQWFGDLMTCKDWSHIWLNESFATYFAHLYIEHKWGKRDFDYSRMRSLGWLWYSSYKRKIQTRVYWHSSDVFDSHTYPKGAAVLHMIRRILGDALWWKAINLYTTRHAHGLVETQDLRRAFEEVSGRNFEPFFDQWIRTAGHPVVGFSYRYNAKQKQLTVTLHQRQKGHVFSFATRLKIGYGKGSRVVPIEVSKRREVVTLSVKTRPTLVELDPDGDILMQIKAKKNPQAWRIQLLHGTGVHSQVRAAKGLHSAVNQPKVLAALSEVLLSEKRHFGVRKAVAKALGQLRDSKACGILRSAMAVEEARVRSAVIAQLGHCQEGHPLEALIARMRLDPSHEVRASAVSAIATLRHKRSLALLKEALSMPGDYGKIQQAALWGLAKLEDIRALPWIEAHMKRGHEMGVRLSAIGIYASLVAFFYPQKKKKATHYQRIAKHLQDPHPWVRRTAVNALGALGDWRAVSLLRRHAAQAPVVTVGRSVNKAIQQIYKQTSSASRLKKFGRSLESLRKTHKALMRRVKQLERQRHLRK